MEPLETIDVDGKVVACDGGVGALGHPRVFLNMGAEGHVDCPYCGRRYRARNHHDASHHGGNQPGHTGAAAGA